MKQRNEFIAVLLLVSAVIWFGQFVPELPITIISVVLFVAIAYFRPTYLLPVLIVYFVSRPFLVELNGGLKLAGDLSIITLVVKVTIEALKQKNYRSIFKLEIYEWAYIGFILVGVISALITGIGLVPIIFQVRKFIMLYLLYYGLKRIEWSPEMVNRSIYVTVLMAMVLSVHGIIEKLSQRQWLIPVTWRDMFLSPTNIERVYGILGNPNSMGLFMITAFVAAIYLYKQTKYKWLYIPLVMISGMILLTYSRGTWIAALVAGAVYVLLKRDWRLSVQVIAVFIIGYFLIYSSVEQLDVAIENSGNITISEPSDGGSSLSDRFNSAFEDEDVERSTSTGRIFFLKKGFEIFKDHPVIGTGFATFGDSATLVYSSPLYPDYGLAGIYDYRNKDFFSDNQYIQIIVQTGVVGTILFAVFMLNMVYRMFKAPGVSKELRYLAISLWFFIGVAGVVYNIWENQVFPLMYFSFLAYFEHVRKDRSIAPKI